MAYQTTLEELHRVFPHKVWYVLLEGLNFKPENIFNMVHTASIEPFNNERLRELWALGNFKIEKRMIFNMEFLENFESFLIKNGLHFNWIMFEGEYIGIRVQPTKTDFNRLLFDCLTFEEFGWHRNYMMIEDEKIK